MWLIKYQDKFGHETCKEVPSYSEAEGIALYLERNGMMVTFLGKNTLRKEDVDNG